MDLRATLRMFISHYFIIYSCIFIATFVYCVIFERNASFDVAYFGHGMLMAFVTDVPVFIFYTKRELSNKEMIIRYIIHFCVIEVTACTSLYLMGALRGFKEIVIGAVLTMFVYAVVVIVGVIINQRSVSEINRQIQIKRKGL